MSATEELDEVVREFLVESYENLDQLDRDLVELEQEPESTETLSSVFRTIHTIKGTCGFLGFGRLEGVTHVGENLLARLRDGRLSLSPEITTALLSMVDAVREMLARIEEQGDDGQEEYADLVARLDALQDCIGEGAPPSAEPPSEAPALSDAQDSEAPPISDSVNAQNEEPQVTNAAVEPAEAELGAPSELPEAPGAAEMRGEDTAGEARQPLADTTIRVDVDLLDSLMNLVGELVLARNQVLQMDGLAENAGAAAAAQRLNLITTELQEGVMKTRMQPIGSVWAKFPRVVRDLSVACGKEVRLEMEGKETELDRTILEAIRDPLTHLVRNAIDHGLETPADRAAAGKPEIGCLSIRALHEGGQVNIEIADDGRGIDAEELKNRAVSKGIVSAERAARLTERECLDLIFEPGFSTAAQVSNISGRGVGMDVVRTNIERIGGVVDVQSVAGVGTTLKMKIPLTLAIIPALTVSCAGELYAIPQVSLLELVRLDGADRETAIESIQGVPVYRLRGELLPLVDLRHALQVEGADSSAAVNIVVLQADDRQFGLLVDGITDTEEIVVKPLGRQLKEVSVFAGATIMGNGRIALILDVLGLAQEAGVVAERGAHQTHQRDQAAQNELDDGTTTLVVRVGTSGRLALPLSSVDRLEEVRPDSIEYSAETEVVQYRGGILPLVRLGSTLGYAPEAQAQVGENDLVPVVVYDAGHSSLGLVVEEIIDIVEEAVDVQHRSDRPGILGSAVLRERVTDVVDMDALIARCCVPAAA